MSACNASTGEQLERAQLKQQPPLPPGVFRGEEHESIASTKCCPLGLAGGSARGYLRHYCFLRCLFCCSASNSFLYLLEQFPV